MSKKDTITVKNSVKRSRIKRDLFEIFEERNYNPAEKVIDLIDKQEKMLAQYVLEHENTQNPALKEKLRDMVLNGVRELTYVNLKLIEFLYPKKAAIKAEIKKVNPVIDLISDTPEHLLEEQIQRMIKIRSMIENEVGE